MNYSRNLSVSVLSKEESIGIKEEETNLILKTSLNKKHVSINSYYGLLPETSKHAWVRNNHRSRNMPFVMFNPKVNSISEKQKINTKENTHLTKLLEVEEINAQIQNLIAIREQLKKQQPENNTTIIIEGKTESWDEKFLRKLLQYIKNNIGDPELNVASIMSQMHISRTQLHRKLKTLTGLSTTEFIRAIRLKKAEQLLKDNVDSVTQIGYQIGFSDHSYFSKCFKKKYGISPSQYSKKFRLG